MPRTGGIDNRRWTLVKPPYDILGQEHLILDQFLSACHDVVATEFTAPSRLHSILAKSQKPV